MRQPPALLLFVLDAFDAEVDVRPIETGHDDTRIRQPEQISLGAGEAVHGLFEQDGFRGAFLTEVGRRAGKTFVPAGVSFAAARDTQFERLADLIEAHLDVDAVGALIEGAAA